MLWLDVRRTPVRSEIRGEVSMEARGGVSANACKVKSDGGKSGGVER